MIDIDLLLASGGVYKKFSPGEIIFNEGVASLYYYQLISGRVRWVNISDEGKEFLQTIVDPGECFGEIPLFDNEPFAATAIADKESVLIRLPRLAFLQLLKENPEIHLEFSKLLCQRIRFKFMVLKEFANHDPEHRISTLLEYFRETKKNICPNCNQVKLTRQEIADMTGLRVETVIRAIKHLEEKGKVCIEKGKVYFPYD